MSYRIEYDSAGRKYEVVPKRSLLPFFIAAAAIFTLIISLWPEGRKIVLSWLIPGDDTVTVHAFSAMTDDLRCGAGVWAAIEGFCRTVINGR